ncbi:M50 family metallopeptidase [Schaalia sp. 19OD2882]|uniref:M50 family metallopeptidase n=1 Tax=Schaalia sp. 19OD2882 TaxID=2794089 RepID=UPI001C1F1C76|nr:M50 family metallopeptidase [Schaalia sp. 19OD2882]QWW18672.1 M50 family metallopeptidase [Schaalia sp. 19OD2882]
MEFLERIIQTFAGAAPPEGGWWAVVATGAALLCVLTPMWKIVRVVVVVTHEVAHALVGLACGRRLTGIVVRMDMGGHAVTQGRPRGLGIVLTTAAGYPAPALVGALLVWASSLGWAPAVLLISSALLTALLVNARSFYSVIAFGALAVGASAAWWLAPATVCAGIVMTVALVLLVGAWRQFGAVLVSGGPEDDPATLGRLTHTPAFLWLAFFALAIGGATWGAFAVALPLLTAPLRALLP